ncbi:MAG: hypothetical protein JRI57_04420 [Deltaproteobacteria bacterium]|nr:hypothetical protein [Deltaproteobacteria bacterium]MBW1951978.1 hypothetical protein [Deltaproteobacteria bacterium]MBW1987237.1 hypothetical protein [Deltaproteobacteria bacterium]MBW2134282.1 hypothetical protein [Deltaproteobacteria bacterium]
MDKNTYADKLQALTDIFQGDGPYAKKVLDQWLQSKKAEFEAEIIAEVNRRLEGLTSIVPVTMRVVIDASGIHLPQAKAKPAPQKAKPAKLEVAEAGKR